MALKMQTLQGLTISHIFATTTPAAGIIVKFEDGRKIFLPSSVAASILDETDGAASKGVAVDFTITTAVSTPNNNSAVGSGPGVYETR
jgi:hypothetical protein